MVRREKELIFADFKWIQVDEVQDLNAIQWGIIEKIASSDALKVLFGDYEQAIFSFMGAKLERLHEYEKMCKSHPHNGIHNLLKNFRSPSYLLKIYIDYAKALLNPKWKKDPISHSDIFPEPGDLQIIEVKGSIRNEAQCIVERVLPPLLKKENERTAIIVRFNKTADIIHDFLKKKGIEHFKVSGFDLFRRKSIKGLLAFLSVINNPFDKISWMRVLYEFKVIPTLKESRSYIHRLVEHGIYPDELLQYNGEQTILLSFLNDWAQKRVILFDTETTGLNTDDDDIIQIAAVEIVGGRIVNEFEIFLKTEKDLSETEKIHGISAEKLAEKGYDRKIGLQKFLNFIKGENTILIAHNLSYDYAILKTNLKRDLNEDLGTYGFIYYDSLDLSRRLYAGLPSYKLAYLIEEFNLEGINSHNALDDVRATVSLLRKIAEDISKREKLFKELIRRESFEKFISKLNEKIRPLYQQFISKKDVFYSLPQAIDTYFKYLIKTNIIKEEDYEKEEKEIQKLTRYVSHFTRKDKFNNLLKKHIPEYLTFSEADLYFGDEQVVLSTVFKAKGLEFDNVIIVETTDNTYPHWSSKDEKSKKEDARTLYVALTRAKKRIFITYHTFDLTPYRSFPRNKSPFLSPIKKYFIEKQC